MNLIEQKNYNLILENMPILCVDGIVVNDKDEILFLKRENEPALNEWWFPGGRVFKGEKLENSIVRKVKEETNLDVVVDRFIGISETDFTTGPMNIPVHTINVTYLLRPISNNIKIDNLHSEYIWSSDFDNLNLNSEIYKLIKSIRFSE
jgi:colanic acid biosynthesis protein WcaH